MGTRSNWDRGIAVCDLVLFMTSMWLVGVLIVQDIVSFSLCACVRRCPLTVMASSEHCSASTLCYQLLSLNIY